MEQRLVAYVHSQRHLRLPAVAAERALTDQDSDQDPLFERRQIRHARIIPEMCFTVMKNVKRGRRPGRDARR
jgi:hypothetical protein